MQSQKHPTARMNVAFVLAYASLSACVPNSKRIRLTANEVKSAIAATLAHFAAEAESICGELPEAETAIVPPLDKVCSRGCMCASQMDAPTRTTYDCSLWRDRAWELLQFQGRHTQSGEIRKTVYFHHKAKWHRTESGCDIEFTVYGDLDEDGIYSTYTVLWETTPDRTVGTWPDAAVLLE